MVGVRRVAVVGGGVSGLATAYRLIGADGAVNVTVLEADARLGGKVTEADVGGIVVDTGPDALMVRSPAASQLVTELGLDDSLRPPSGAGAVVPADAGVLCSLGATQPASTRAATAARTAARVVRVARRARDERRRDG